MTRAGTGRRPCRGGAWGPPLVVADERQRAALLPRVEGVGPGREHRALVEGGVPAVSTGLLLGDVGRREVPEQALVVGERRLEDGPDRLRVGLLDLGDLVVADRRGAV